MAYMRDSDGNRLDEIAVKARLEGVETADATLDSRVDAIEAAEATYGDIVTHNAAEFTTDAELAAEATARANGDSAEVTARNNAIAAQAATDATLYGSKSYELSGVELANAEVGYAVSTTFPVSPASPVAITGAVINVPTLTGPFDILYGCDARVTTAGGGLLRLDLRETVNFSASQDWASFPITADFSVSLLQSGYKIPLRGRKRFPASASGKTYFLTILLYRDTSSGLVAVAQNQPDMLTFMTAVGR